MKRILVIEDNRDLRENTAEILSLANYDVEVAENGKEGVEKAKSADFDLIICDIMMPGLDGYGVLHILNKDPRTSTIPFIFLTAKAEKADFRKGMSLGADDYLTKPFHETELLETIEMRLNKFNKLKAPSADADEAQVTEYLQKAGQAASITDLITDQNTRFYKRKERIYSEGGYPHALHYIKSGRVKLSKSNEQGKELIVQVSGPGEFIGYLPLFEESTYSEDAIALEDTEVVLISTDKFMKLMYSYRDLTNNFISILSRNVAEKEERLLKLAYGNIRERVASAILELFEKHGGNDQRLDLILSREELAAYTGIATESLIRTVSDFKSEGMITNEGKAIIIKDHQKLKRVASGKY